MAGVFAFNETHDFSAFTRNNSWWPKSEYYTLFVNLVIYGGLTLAIRGFVIARLPTLLNGEDSLHVSATRPAS